jgi:hypothetical protein
MNLPAIFKPKIILFFILFGASLFLIADKVRAANEIPLLEQPALNNYYFEKTVPVYQMEKYGGNKTDLFKSRFDANTVNNLVDELGTLLLGTFPTVTQQTGVYNPGAVGIASALVGGLVGTPPVSTTQYLADLGSSLGIVKPAYAQQGTGWSALQPVITVWKVFRNLSYLVFVFIFVIIGFMIMFRAKINPQTVISVEAAIPNLIITLIIITFSYAIASFMIDLIWVGIYLVINIFSTYGILTNVSEMQKDILGKNVISLLFSGPVLGGGRSVAGAAASAVGATVENILWGGGQVQGSVTGIVASGLAYLIIAIALIFSMFKLFFQLLISYIGLIVSVIFAPFQLLGNALPGGNSLSGWLKGLLANALVFPATVVMILLAAALTNSETWGAGSGVGFNGTTGTGGIPLLYAGDPNAIKGLIGLGMIMMTPRVVEMIKNALKIEKGAGGGIGGAAAPLMGVVGMPGQALQQVVMLGQARQYLKPSIPQEKGPYPAVAPTQPTSP